MMVVISVKESVAAATKQITQQQREIVSKSQDPISSASSFLSGLLPCAARNQWCFNIIKDNQDSSGEVSNQIILIYVKLVLKTTTILIFVRIQIKIAMKYNCTVTSMANSCWLLHVLVKSKVDQALFGIQAQKIYGFQNPLHNQKISDSTPSLKFPLPLKI